VLPKLPEVFSEPEVEALPLNAPEVEPLVVSELLVAGEVLLPKLVLSVELVLAVLELVPGVEMEA
jgi:hypothetical protein